MTWLATMTTEQLLQSARIKVANMHAGLRDGTSVSAAHMATEAQEIAAIFAEIAKREAA